MNNLGLRFWPAMKMLVSSALFISSSLVMSVSSLNFISLLGVFPVCILLVAEMFKPACLSAMSMSATVISWLTLFRHNQGLVSLSVNLWGVPRSVNVCGSVRMVSICCAFGLSLDMLARMEFWPVRVI